MNIIIKIAECAEGKRAVCFNGDLSHHVRESELQAARKEAAYNFWKTDAANGVKLGGQLYRFLSGSGGQLDSIIEESRQSAEPLFLNLEIPYEINSLPFELLHNAAFLAQQNFPKIYLIRKVTDRHGRKHHTPERRSLKVLFMACSRWILVPMRY